jgi:hypothetical protein
VQGEQGVLWACGIAGGVGLVLGLRYRVLVVVVLTWAVMLLAIGTSLSTGGSLRSGFVAALAAIAALHTGYFGSSVARWAWTGNENPAGSRAPRRRWRRYALSAEGSPDRPPSSP